MSAGPVRLTFQVGEEERPQIADLRAPSTADLPAEVPLEESGVHRLHLTSLTAAGGLEGCLACGHPELYRRKDFPRGVGVTIVVLAAVLAPFTKYLSLVIATLLDSLIYLFAPDSVVCYVCDAHHRGFAPQPRHPKFDREIDERLRYGERAVMGRPMRPGGTAGAPEPEH